MGGAQISRLRRKIRRDNLTCFYCGEEATTIEHLKPRVYGGRDSINNIVPACRVCNEERGTMPHMLFKRFVRRFGRPERRWSKNTNRYKFYAIRATKISTSNNDQLFWKIVERKGWSEMLVRRALKNYDLTNRVESSIIVFERGETSC